MLRRALSAFLIALEFLTVIPIGGRRDYNRRTVGLSLVWFPVVGLLIGCVLAGVDLVASAATTPAVTVVLVLAANAVLTGALHLDGLADTADGVFGGRTPERRLEIMKDSRIGTFGLVAVTLALLLQYSALASIGDSTRRSALLIVPAVARCCTIYLISAYPYVRPSGIGRTLKEQATPALLGIGVAITLLMLALVPGTWHLSLLPVAFLVAWTGGAYFARALGGLTGDTYGAMIVLVEAALFVIVSADLPEPWDF